VGAAELDEAAMKEPVGAAQTEFATAVTLAKHCANTEEATEVEQEARDDEDEAAAISDGFKVGAGVAAGS
jgi:hypothetical protein